MTDSASETWADVAQERASSRGALIAERLRLLAQDIEHVRVRADLNDMEPDYGRYAADIQHKVIWGLANLHVDGLVRDAAEADRAVRSSDALKTRVRALVDAAKFLLDNDETADRQYLLEELIADIRQALAPATTPDR